VPLYRTQVSGFEGNGFEKVRNFLKIFVKTIELHPDPFRFLGAMDHYFNSRQKPEALAEKMKIIFHDDPTIQFLNEALDEGVRDGSIRAETDPRKMAYAIDQTMVSLGQRIASRREEMICEFGLETPETMAELMAETILTGLKAGGGNG